MLRPTPVGFAEALWRLAQRYHFSVTSWGRTPWWNKKKGGADNSRHLEWLAIDVVLDPHEQRESFLEDCRFMGIHYDDEGDHIHLQAVPPRPK